MNKNIESVMSEFQASADGLFFYFSRKFKDAAYSLDREKDENVFQQLGSQYTSGFKAQLTEIALELVEKNRSLVENADQMQRSISQRLDVYVNEFGQQTKQL